MYNPDRLRFCSEKRIQTTMIGALARIESTFGFLWGHDKDPDDPLTAEEEKFSNMWEYLRNDILNYGNKQIRQFKDDFGKYSGSFKSTYQYNFPLTKDKKDEN